MLQKTVLTLFKSSCQAEALTPAWLINAAAPEGVRSIGAACGGSMFSVDMDDSFAMSCFYPCGRNDVVKCCNTDVWVGAIWSLGARTP